MWIKSGIPEKNYTYDLCNTRHMECIGIRPKPDYQYTNRLVGDYCIQYWNIQLVDGDVIYVGTMEECKEQQRAIELALESGLSFIALESSVIANDQS